VHCERAAERSSPFVAVLSSAGNPSPRFVTAVAASTRLDLSHRPAVRPDGHLRDDPKKRIWGDRQKSTLLGAEMHFEDRAVEAKTALDGEEPAYFAYANNNPLAQADPSGLCTRYRDDGTCTKGGVAENTGASLIKGDPNGGFTQFGPTATPGMQPSPANLRLHCRTFFFRDGCDRATDPSIIGVANADVCVLKIGGGISVGAEAQTHAQGVLSGEVSGGDPNGVFGAWWVDAASCIPRMYIYAEQGPEENLPQPPEPGEGEGSSESDLRALTTRTPNGQYEDDNLYCRICTWRRPICVDILGFHICDP
jgi:hypothetical protein